MDRIKQLLQDKSYPLLIIAFLFTVPFLFMPLTSDDLFHRYFFLNQNHASTLLSDFFYQINNMFAFFSHKLNNLEPAIQLGTAPWWTDRELQISFWRPLSAFTHWLDYQLWPNSTFMMHLHSSLWFVAMFGALFKFFRRFLKSSIVPLAVILLICDYSIYEPLSWIASRNSMIAVFFAVISIIYLDKSTKSNGYRALLISMLCLLFSLLAAEGGITTIAFSIPYLIFCDKRSLKEKMPAIIITFLIIICWRYLYNLQGFGAQNTGLYIDPLTNISGFFAAFISRAPILILNHFFLTDPLYVLIAPELRVILIAAAIAIILLFTFIFKSQIMKDDRLKFFLSAMVLSSIPVCSISLLSSRLQVFISIAAMGFMACLVSIIFDLYRKQTDDKCADIRIRFKNILCNIALIIHIPISAALILALSSFVALKAEEKPPGVFDSLTQQDLYGKRVYLLSSPHTFDMLYLPYKLSYNNQVMPEHVRILSTAFNTNTFTVIDDYTLRMSNDAGMDIYPHSYIENGYKKVSPVYLDLIKTSIFRQNSSPIQNRDIITFVDMEILIQSTTDAGEPTDVDFIFSYPLDDINSLWYQWSWQEQRYIKVDLSRNNQKQTLKNGALITQALDNG